VFEGGEIVKHVGINADECPHNKILEAEAVPKSRHNDNVQATEEGVPDLMQWSVHANQPNDVVVLIAKATTKLMDRQAPRGMTKGGRRVGEGETEWRQGMKNRRRREA
jgi:hypothetical protein